VKALLAKDSKINQNDLIALMTKFHACKVKNGSYNPTLWYAARSGIYPPASKYRKPVQKRTSETAIMQASTYPVGFLYRSMPVCLKIIVIFYRLSL